MKTAQLLGWALAAALLPATPSGAVDRATATSCGGNLHKADGRDVLFASSASATCPWAFTEDSLVIACEAPSSAIAVTEDERTFALNGTAHAVLDLPHITPIWRENPDISGAKINIGPWIDVALALCR